MRCEESAALCSEAAGRPGTVHRQSSKAGQPMSGTVPPRYGKAVFNLAAIPPGTLGLPPRRQSTKSLPGSQEAAVPAAGAACVGHLAPKGTPGVRHTLRRWLRVSVVAKYLYSTDSARERGRLYPARPFSRAHSFGPSRPRFRRPSAKPCGCRSLSGSGSLRSPIPCTAKARQPHRARPPPEPTLHCVPRP